MPDQSDRMSAVDDPGDQSSDALIDDMLMVEEISIDGMCGVY